MRPGCELRGGGDVARGDSWGMRHAFLWLLQPSSLGAGGPTLRPPPREGAGGLDARA